MTFGSEMRELAVELINDFSEELGPITIRHKTGTAYDPVTGTNVDVWETVQLNAVFSKLTLRDVPDQSFLKNHLKCTIAGDDISFTPEVDDIIEKQDGTTYRIDSSFIDQYSAAISFILRKSNES